MTLKQLRDRLDELLETGVDPDAEIVTEGCDCDGDVANVTYESRGRTDTVYLERSKEIEALS